MSVLLPKSVRAITATGALLAAVAIVPIAAQVSAGSGAPGVTSSHVLAGPIKLS